MIASLIKLNAPKTVFFGIIAAVLVTGILVGGSSQQSTAATDITIPDWVKNNAAWWSSGEIADADYASGIEYMIEAGIIKVASAQGMTDGEPFDELWDAIVKLQNDFANIQVIDGITGPQGEQGTQGEQGPKGDQGSPGDSGSADLSALEARITSLENSMTNSGDYTIIYSGTRLQVVKIFEPHEVALIQTPTCPRGEFAAGFGINQQIGIPATLKPLDIGTFIQTPISDFGKLAVRGTNPNDVQLTTSFEIFCGKIVSLDTVP